MEQSLEIRKNVDIVHAEVKAGTRVFQDRGYDVIRNHFFVIQTIKANNSAFKDGDKKQIDTFQSFSEYYYFLNGDIYNKAVYYQYTFSEEEIDEFNAQV